MPSHFNLGIAYKEREPSNTWVFPDEVLPHIENPLVCYRKKSPKPTIKDRESPALWDLAFVTGTDSEKEAIKS